MNAQTSVRASWENFRTTVWSIFPKATGEELELRARLLLIRDLAIQAMGYSSEEAYHLLRAVAEMAGRYALADVSLAQLKEMRRILVLTSSNANSMQVLINDINHQSEGQNARG